jgi:cytochrome c
MKLMKKYLTLVVTSGLLAFGASVHAAVDDKTASALMSKAQCTACHNVERKLVGPSFKQVAQKRKDEKDAVAVIVKKVREGGTGAYGQIPMPPNPKNKISDADLNKLAEWILTK